MKKTANTGSTAVELEKELGMSEEELFSFAEYHPEEAERTGYSEYSYWKSVFRSFRKNKAAVIMIVVFIAIFIFSYVALVIGKYDYQHLVVDSSLCFQRPNKEFWFGTDNLGRDYWCQVWYATKTSIKLAALVAVGECLVGVTLGCIWGYVRKADRIFTEIYNIFVSVPTMIYMTLIALFIGQSFWVMCASIIFFHWMYMAKNVRNLVFIYRDREYNLASRCLGTRLSRVLTRNILPYVELKSLDEIGVLLGAVKTQNIQIYGVEIDRGGEEHHRYPSAVLSVRLEHHQQHPQVLAALSEITGVIMIEEI